VVRVPPTAGWISQSIRVAAMRIPWSCFWRRLDAALAMCRRRLPGASVKAGMVARQGCNDDGLAANADIQA
jgi:hypothetical protein